MSDFGTATYENRSFAARRAKNCKSRLQNNQFWNRLRDDVSFYRGLLLKYGDF
jgi:hypothetical protein